MSVKDSCLYNYIGLRDVADEPASGLFVNMLPGISTELADKSRHRSDTVDIEEFWDDVQTWAITTLREDVIAELSAKVRFNQIIYQTRKPVVATDNVIASTEKRGVYVKLPVERFLEFSLKQVYIYVSAPVTTNIYSTDISTGVTTTLKADAALLAGFNTVDINQTFALSSGNLELFIHINGDVIATKLFKQDYLNWYHEDMSCYQPCVTDTWNEQLFIRPATDTGTLTLDYQAKGIWINGEVNCSTEVFLCENKAHFKTPFWYLLGVKLLEYKKMSPRLNFFTTSNIEYTEANQVKLMGEYMKSLKQKVESLRLQGDSLCLDCEDKATVSYGGQMP